MKKVGILTFHEGFNHGGFFQAFFLQCAVERLGYEVLILNYKHPSHWISENLSQFWLLSPTRVLQNFRKRVAFRRDQGSLKVWPRNLTFRTRKIGRFSRRLDGIVVGSDIVWDFDYRSTGKGSLYFGQGLEPMDALVSYAASMGRSRGPVPHYAASGLRRFGRISVRDANTQALVQAAVQRLPEKVLDPTMLLPIESLKMPLYSGRTLPERYLLVYAYYIPRAWIPAIETFARSRGLSIVITGYHQPIAGIDAVDLGPFDWLQAVKGADFVVTSTFHGTIFSVLTNKRFITIGNDGISNKARSLLKDLDLEDRYFETRFDAKVLEDGVDWGAVRARLLTMRATSLGFLTKALQVSP